MQGLVDADTAAGHEPDEFGGSLLDLLLSSLEQAVDLLWADPVDSMLAILALRVGRTVVASRSQKEAARRAYPPSITPSSS